MGLMVIGYFDIVCIAITESEAYAPLVINRYCMLSASVILQSNGRGHREQKKSGQKILDLFAQPWPCIRNYIASMQERVLINSIHSPRDLPPGCPYCRLPL